MVRKKVFALTLNYKCPLCGKHTFKLQDLAMHLAMDRDGSHVNWRRKHGLPENYTKMTEVHRMKRRIEEIIKREEEKYLTEKRRLSLVFIG